MVGRVRGAPRRGLLLVQDSLEYRVESEVALGQHRVRRRWDGLDRDSPGGGEAGEVRLGGEETFHFSSVHSVTPSRCMPPLTPSFQSHRGYRRNVSKCVPILFSLSGRGGGGGSSRGDGDRDSGQARRQKIDKGEDRDDAGGRADGRERGDCVLLRPSVRPPSLSVCLEVLTRGHLLPSFFPSLLPSSLALPSSMRSRSSAPADRAIRTGGAAHET